jgi:NAD(P)-dependent dehydrogenase (short-subunit alcohol dehydrogenase family)
MERREWLARPPDVLPKQVRVSLPLEHGRDYAAIHRLHGAAGATRPGKGRTPATFGPTLPLEDSTARQLNEEHREVTVTLITGANKGLGYETARQLIQRGHTVYLGARNAERGAAAASELGGHFVQLDVTDDASVEAALGAIAEREGRLDVLVNNAGISTTAEVSGPVAQAVFDTNAIGVIRVTQAALPFLEQSENPVVVNVSSALGSFWAVTNPERRQFHFPSIVYGSSKAAVSMLTVQYAKTFPGIKFNAVEPGFTATDLTPFSGAGQPVEQGAEVIVRMATIGPGGPTGTFSEGEGELAW